MTRTNFGSTVVAEHARSGEKLSLLAVFAHPEDESFGPAGTLAKYVNEGVHVSLVTTTRATVPASLERVTWRSEDPVSAPRDRLCSCRTSGVRRACLFDYHPGQLS